MSIVSVVTGWMDAMRAGPAKLDGTAKDIAHNIAFGEGPTFARKRVTADSTMQLATAWACVRLNARTIGSLPLKLYERSSALARVAAEGHPLYRVLQEAPNPDQSAMEFWEGQVTALNLRGNAYARIGRRGDDQVVALWPVSPDACSPYRTAAGERRYTVSTGGSTEDLAATDIFHLRGFGAGGDQGLSPISYGRQTIATTIAAEEVAGGSFANGLQLAGFVEVASGTKLTDDQRKQLVDMFAKFRSETDGKHAFALGQTGIAPPTASIVYAPDTTAPLAANWTATGATLTSTEGSLPAIEIDGTTSDDPNVAGVLFELRVATAGQDADAGWETISRDPATVTRKVTTSVTPGTVYDVSIRYDVRGITSDRLILPGVTAGALAIAGTASNTDLDDLADRVSKLERQSGGGVQP